MADTNSSEYGYGTMAMEDDRIAQLIARGEVIPAVPLEHPIEPMPVTGPMTATEALMEERNSY